MVCRFYFVIDQLAIKIDGKSIEWNDQFQAHNNATGVSYTMSNDDKNLYLVIQATNHDVINTIIGYGFTFVIQKSGRKNDRGKISIGYPVYDSKNHLNSVLGNYTEKATIGTSDSIANAYNERLDQKLKTLIVTGIEGIDTLSVYNNDGIKAAGAFNNKLAYTFELAISLKRIGLSENEVSKFAYHMIINGYRSPEKVKVTMPANASPEYIAGFEQGMADMNSKIAQKYAHTDFFGEYS